MSDLLSFVNSSDPPQSLFFGRSKKMRAMRQKLTSLAHTNIPVLIQGESGTGKDVCVRLIHQFSGADMTKLVKVSCPALPAALMETELFGYEKGAFTGAQSTRRGRVEKAAGGTLFLDDVGTLDLVCQAKLLQLLQDGTFYRVGGHYLQTVQTRFICVASQSLQKQVTDGNFRLDLLYRINTVVIDLPALRDRKEDIPDLVGYFIARHAREFATKPRPLSRAVLRQLITYEWPGNIRQLDNVIRSYVLVGDEEALLLELQPAERALHGDLIPDIDLSTPISLKELTRQATYELERHVILRVLRANGWNRQKTAKWLKMSYRSLLYKLNDASREEMMRTPQPRPAAKPTAINSQSSLGTSLRQL